MNPTNIFFLGIILAASGLVGPPVALVGGLAFGMLLQHPFPEASRVLSRLLLQASVVLLGFGMNLHEVWHAGREGVLYTAVSLAVALALGWALGRLMRVQPKASFLITCGTAICGGSAIAALAPVMDAGEEDLAISLGTVFSLNAVALLVFPLIGWRMHLSQSQFGLWAALAIHDTSSVVGAAARFGPQALEIGTAVKLARALWIVPVSLVTAGFVARLRRRGATEPETGSAKLQLPWFIGLFVMAAALRTAVPSFMGVYAHLTVLGRSGLTVVLFLIGSGISRATLQRVGVRPMAQGVILWIAIATASLFAIRAGWVAL